MGEGAQSADRAHPAQGMTDSRRWFLLVSLLLACWVVWLLSPVLTPFLVGALLAFIGDPLADRLERAGLSRTQAVVVVFVGLSLVAALLLLFLVPLLYRQTLLLITKVPAIFDWLQQWALPRLSELLDVDLSIDVDAVKQAAMGHWKEAGTALAHAVGGVSRSGLAIVEWLTNLVLIPVVTFYLLRDWDRLVARVREMLPRRVEPTVVRLAFQCEEVLGSFFRGQLLVMLVQGAIYAVGLWIVGLDLALLIGMLAGLVSFVPYLGVITGLGTAVVAALIQFHDLRHVAYVAVVFAVGHVTEGMVLQPLLIGDRVGLHPVAVIFAVLAGGKLFGLSGMLLALPAAAVVAVLVRYAYERYRASPLYGSQPPA